MNDVFCPGTTTECTARRLFKKFCSGEESYENDKRSGRPSNVVNDQLKGLVNADPRTTVRKLVVKIDVALMTATN